MYRDISILAAMDILGITSFAISGALCAIRKKFDLFGVLIIAFVTALGGGILRDVIIGRLPVWWIKNAYILIFIGLGVIIAIVFRNKINTVSKGLFLFDSIGLGVATIIGVELGIQFELSAVISIVLGTMTGCFGGVLRDVLCNEVPVLFRKEIYATASLIGGLCFVVFIQFNIDLNIVYAITGLIIVIIRVVVVKYKISLPVFLVKSSPKQ